MTTPIIEIVNGNQRIAFPLAALVHFDRLVDLSHLVLCGVPVQAREEGAVEAAKQSIADAAASDDPMAALKALAAGVKRRQDSELTAEKLEPGQKTGEDPAVRLLVHVTKCAESLGIKPPKDMPIGAIVTSIAKQCARQSAHIDVMRDTGIELVKRSGLEPSDSGKHSGSHDNLISLGRAAQYYSEHEKASNTSVLDLHIRLRTFGIEIQSRENGSAANLIDDATNAIGLAGRRGHKLASKAPA